MPFETSIFDFSSYNRYLQARLGDKASRTGLKKKAADFIPCTTSYLSRVLQGNAHPSLEQANQLNLFFQHTSQEAHYFLLLVQKDRAGTVELRDYFDGQLKQCLEQREDIKLRVGDPDVLTAEQGMYYYKDWTVSCIHILLSIKSLQTAEAIAKYLGLARVEVANVLEFLVKAGLAESSGGSYKIKRTKLMIGNDSLHIDRHHTNWRLKAIDSMRSKPKGDLHYSSVFSLSEKDADLIKEKLLKYLEELLKTVEKSQEETAYCFLFDFFCMRK